MDEDGLISVEEGNSGSRKKNKTVGVREKAKNIRYSAPAGCRVFTPCIHNNKRFKCVQVRPEDAKTIRNSLYNIPNKLIQDTMISSFLGFSSVKRKRPNQRPPKVSDRPSKPKPHTLNVNYTVFNKQGKVIPICKKLFLQITKIKNTRLQNIVKKVKANQSLKDNRGGDRVSHKSGAKKAAVRQFLGKLKGRESHYNRKKSMRIYLSSDLNIGKLHNIYNKTVTLSLKVKKTMFRKVFCEFNIGFKSPASDICSFCHNIDLQLKKEKMASIRNEAAINDLILKKRVHKKRAKAFYELMKETKENELTICFDLQQVQPLPRSPVQEAFYLRQLSFYALCVVGVEGKNPVFYSWTEDQSGRGSTEVSSALLHYLQSLDLTGITRLRLFCDGCGAQNKNNIVVHTLMYFLGTHQGDVEQILMTFPVRGHSFLPADRTFGQVEKKLRKRPTILTKEEYYEIYNEVGEIRKLGEDWCLFNTKSLSSRFKNVDMISQKKRIIIQKEEETVTRRRGSVTSSSIKVKAHENFRFEADSETAIKLYKKGWTHKRAFEEPVDVMTLGHPIPPAKKKDVESLLKTLYGEWENDVSLSWYKDVLNCSTGNDEETVEENTQCCDCLEDDCGLHI